MINFEKPPILTDEELAKSVGLFKHTITDDAFHHFHSVAEAQRDIDYTFMMKQFVEWLETCRVRGIEIGKHLNKFDK